VDDEHQSAVRRVAEALRVEISQLQPHARLPSQQLLTQRFKVSRDTVQRALKQLHAQGLIVSTPGSGSYVADLGARERSGAAGADGGGDDGGADAGDDEEGALEPAIVALEPYLDDALRQPRVTIDFFGFTCETLTTLLKPRLDKLRGGSAFRPDALTIRVLVPAMDTLLALPRSVEDPGDRRPLERLRAIATQSISVLETAVTDFRVRGLIPEAQLLVRTVPMTPQVKLYIINRTVALRGWYEVARHPVQLPVLGGDGAVEEVEIFDLMGLDASLIPQRPSSTVEAQSWFDSVWSTITGEWRSE
jgi:Bacterial regulatory proteins, gntR family